MHIAILGYGKMGKTIERLAGDNTISIVKGRSTDVISTELKDISPDVVIEFTSPESVISHIKMCIDLRLPMVTGSTGWYDNMETIKAYCLEHDGSLFWASNFSIGAHLFFEINERLALIMNAQPDYDVQVKEIHHTEKKDRPSGTAIAIGQGIIKNLERKISWTIETPDSDHQLAIFSERIGRVKGTHQVTYSSAADQISIEHKAINRDGFAQGAIHAAHWLFNRKGIFTMKDMLSTHLV